MTSVSFGKNGKYITIQEPTWEQLLEVILSRDAKATGLYSRGLVFSCASVMISLATIENCPDRVLMRLHFPNPPSYRLIDPTIKPCEEDKYFVLALDSEVESALIHETLKKSEAIEIFHTFYHKKELPPKTRWVPY